jgi:hypothetical protein
MIGKIIRIKDDLNTRYIKIKEFDGYTYSGYGFAITNFDVGFMYNFTSDVLTVTKDYEPSFEIINEVEFNRSFDQMINNMRYKHMQEML